MFVCNMQRLCDWYALEASVTSPPGHNVKPQDPGTGLRPPHKDKGGLVCQFVFATPSHPPSMASSQT